MSEEFGFELLWSKQINELQGVANLYRYSKNGAEVLSIENNDENKVFGITFRTPPKDSSGIAHILEHSVLNGSQKYPLKEPFVELLKGSLQTFLNAMTFPDKTCYPVASQNVQDLYNLMDVYLDAVFYPLITRDVFEQEGWHLELTDENSHPDITGVVYNEMKGAYSSPDGLLSEYSQQSLFPSTAYSLDSGGNPTSIPYLTYEEFLEFHRNYYHPSNARFFIYGDDDPGERLRKLHEYLKDFDKTEVDSRIGLQPRLTKPRHLEHYYIADEQSESKNMCTVNWLLDVTTNVENNLELQVLEYILIGMPGSPLRKALIDSGLGEDLAGVGLERELRQMFFSTGLKGVSEDDLPRVEEVIFDTLKDLAEEGIDKGLIEASMNTVEFELRENNTGSLPRGLLVMLSSLSTWLYDNDPTLMLAYEEPLSDLKQRLDSGEPVFEHLINTNFLENKHWTRVDLKPDPELGDKLEEAERSIVREKTEGFEDSDKQALIERTRELKRKQQEPDDPEEVAKVPRLKIEDLPEKVKQIPLEVTEGESENILYHHLDTNNILYLDLGFDLKMLPQKYLGYLPMFGRAILEMGTDKEDFVSLSKKIQAKTGGIHTETFNANHKYHSEPCSWMFLRGKALSARMQDLLDILQEILSDVQFDDKERFKQLLLEEKSRQEHRIVPIGHRIVNSRLKAKYNLISCINEQMHGLSQLLFLRYLASEVDNNWQGILSDLENMRNILLSNPGMLVNVTLDRENWKDFQPRLQNFLQQVPTRQKEPQKWQTECMPGHEAIQIPSQVNYVGKGFNLYEQGYEFHGSSLVITRYLRTSWLWDKLRVQGGAYGAFSNLDRYSGVMSFVSYRDPNLLNTLENYDQTADFLENSDLEDEEINKAIVGAVGDMDSYQLPDDQGMTSMLRYIVGETDEKRQELREEIMKTTKSDFRNFGTWLQNLRDKGEIVVLGDKSNISKAQEQGLKFAHVWSVF